MNEAEFDAILSRKDINKIRDLAELPELSLELQRKLFAYPDSEVKNSLVKKIQDKSIVDSVLASGDPMAIRWAVRNPLVTRNQLAQAVETPQTDVLIAIAGNSNSDLIILKQCMEHSRQDEYLFAINGAIVTNPNATSDLIQEIFDEFGLPEKSYYGYNLYLERLASSSQTPIEILKILSVMEDKTSGRSLVTALVNNPSVTVEIQRDIFERGGVEERVVIAESDGTKNDIVVSQAYYYWNTYNWGGPMYSNSRYSLYIQENTYVKMREIAIGYNFGSNIAKKIGATKLRLSVFGRNLFYLYRTLKDIDSEQTTAGSRWYQNVSNVGTNPSSRTYGVMLRASF